MSQKIKIEMTWDYANFHCPLCGAAIITKDGEMPKRKCKHLKYVYLDIIGDYMFLDKAIEKQIREKKKLSKDDEIEVSPFDASFRKYVKGALMINLAANHPDAPVLFVGLKP